MLYKLCVHLLTEWGLNKNICLPCSRSKSSCVWFFCCYMLTCSTADKVCIKDESGFIWVAAGIRRDSKLHLLFAHSQECTCEQGFPPSLLLLETHLGSTPPSSPRQSPPSLFLLYLATTATTNMQAGRQLTHLDYLPPPSVSHSSPTPSLSCHISSRSVVSPSSLLSLPPDSLTVTLSLLSTSKLKYSERQVAVCCCFMCLFGGHWEAGRGFDL